MKKVVIIGSGASWRECPTNGEIWASATSLLADDKKDLPYTRLFAFDRPRPRIQQSLDIAKSRGIPVCSKWEYGTELYPIKGVVQRFKTNYLKNTFSYMLALALYEGYDRIWVLALDNPSEGDRADWQRAKPWITYWLGVAIGMGIVCNMNIESLKWLYTFWEPEDKCPNCYFLKLAQGKEPKSPQKE